MQTHSVHGAAGVKPVTTIHQCLTMWSISGNYTQFNKTPNSTKNKIGESRQHTYQDVKILNINDRKRLTNMHTQQPMN